MTCWQKLLLLSCTTVLAGIWPWAGPADWAVREFLQRPLLGREVPLREVQAFLESRISPFRPPLSAQAWQREAEEIRRAVLEKIVFRGAAAQWRVLAGRVDWLETIPGGPGYSIRKLRYEALPGLWIPALLYQPEPLSGKAPVVLNVNGHDRLGKAAPYKQLRCINLAKRGMLALNVEWFGMGQLAGENYEHYRMNQLDLCGTSGLAPFYLALERALDLLLSLEHADPQRVAVAGLSGGGWQTIFISALDPRVRLANPVVGYSSFRTRVHHLDDLGDSEQTPSDLATIADYTHLTALRAPRPTLLTYNEKDECCFATAHALPPLVEVARPVFALLGAAEALRTHNNREPGTHNFERENREALYRMLGDHFFPEDPSFDWREIPSEDELKRGEDLQVELPDQNADFHSLAVRLLAQLPSSPVPAELKENPSAVRTRWARQIRFHRYPVEAEAAGEEAQAGVQARFWRLKLGGDWTVPVVELSRDGAQRPVLVVSDEGRGASAPPVHQLLLEGHRVLAIDPFYFGESAISSKDHLFALLVAAVGERTLGIQVSQVAAVARWYHEWRGAPVEVMALGPRTGTAALLAAALESESIAAVRLSGALQSLREVVEKNWTARDRPELFAFGLLEYLDLKDVKSLISPRPVRQLPAPH